MYKTGIVSVHVLPVGVCVFQWCCYRVGRFIRSAVISTVSWVREIPPSSKFIKRSEIFLKISMSNVIEEFCGYHLLVKLFFPKSTNIHVLLILVY